VTGKTRRPLSDADFHQIIRLMEALERSNFDSLQLDGGNFKLTLGKGGCVPAAPAPTAPPINQRAAAIPDPVAPAPASVSPVPVAPAEPAAGKASAASETDTVAVRSPIMGLFYSRPDPSSPPFVSLGTEVIETTSVGLIEVMKVFNAVQAGANGVIVEICVQDAETIEIGQTLFRIRPTGMV
jgi:acetyl-CoA carboxylase biotin carboxyl carrier protein